MKDEDFVYRIIRACGSSTANSDINVFALERIIEDIRAAEREACAKLCESMGVHPALNVWNGGPEWYQRQKECAAAIRATGDMSTKPQNVYTSEERVQETDKSIHDLRAAAEMALGGLITAQETTEYQRLYKYFSECVEQLRQALAQPEQRNKNG